MNQDVAFTLTIGVSMVLGGIHAMLFPEFTRDFTLKTFNWEMYKRPWYLVFIRVYGVLSLLAGLWCLSISFFG